MTWLAAVIAALLIAAFVVSLQGRNTDGRRNARLDAAFKRARMKRLNTSSIGDDW